VHGGVGAALMVRWDDLQQVLNEALSEWKKNTCGRDSKRVEPKPWKIRVNEGQPHFPCCVNDAQISRIFCSGFVPKG